MVHDGRRRFELESDVVGEHLSVYAVSHTAFIRCRPPRRQHSDDDNGKDVHHLTSNSSATLTRRHLLHNQSNYFIGTSPGPRRWFPRLPRSK